MPARKRSKLVFLEKIIQTLAQKLGYDANMVSVIKCFQVVYTISATGVVNTLSNMQNGGLLTLSFAGQTLSAVSTPGFRFWKRHDILERPG